MQTPFLATLGEACEAAIYRAVAAAGPHRLGYEKYSRSHTLGVALPEAAPSLYAWRTTSADGEDGRGRLMTGAMIRMGAADAALEQTASRAVALAERDDLPLVTEEPTFDGYDWYDALERVTAVNLRSVRDGVALLVEEHDRPELASGQVETITVELAIAGPAGDRIVALPSDVALLVVDDYTSDLDALALLVTPEPAIDVPALVDLLVAAAFCPSDDRDADSYDTQRDHFEREALQLARTHLLGADAGIIGRALDRATDHIRWLVPAGRTLVMTITREAAEAAFRDPPAALTGETSFIAEIEALARRGSPETAVGLLNAIVAACIARRETLLAP